MKVFVFLYTEHLSLDYIKTMKTLLISDLHVDTYFEYAVKASRLKLTDPSADVVYDTLAYMWYEYGIPSVEAIVIAGDISNDFLTFKRTVYWLSEKYKKVYIVLGNHDIVVRGATCSTSNDRFTTSEEKIMAMADVCREYKNVFLLENNVIDSIAGCIGMCDFKCDVPYYGLDPKLLWSRNWFDGQHWNYFGNDPDRLCEHYAHVLDKLVEKQPRTIVTHFAPYELGIPRHYLNNQWNFAFYFKAEKYLDKLDHETYWLCGHTHDRRTVDYENAKGHAVHIVCNPLGYPQDSNDIKIVKDARNKLLQKFVIDV